MGIIWDLIQDFELLDQRGKATCLEERVEELELQLKETRKALLYLLKHIDGNTGNSINVSA